MYLLLVLSAFSLVCRLLSAHDGLFALSAVFCSVRTVYKFIAAYDAFLYILRLCNRYIQLFILRQYGAFEPLAKHGVGVQLRTRAVEYKAISIVIVTARLLN